jgi:hypothetical protein
MSTESGLSAYALCSLEDVKSFLGISSTDTTKDELLETIINGVSGSIEDYCQRKFLAREYTDTIRNHWGRVLTLRQYPIIEVTSLTVEGTELTEEDDYAILSSIGGIDFYSTMSIWKIEVEYTAGYEAIPDALRLLTMEMVQATYSKYGQNRETESEQVLDEAALLETFKAKLAVWRKR